MVQRRDFGPVAVHMREALDKYSREELADMLTHIVRVYVIEGKEPALSDTGKVSSDDSLRTLTFAQLILHLQMNLPHPELQSFRVSGDRVWAERHGHEVLMAGTPTTDEVPPDWEDIAPREPPRSRPTESSRPRGVRAVTGPTETIAPTAAAPSVGTQRRRRREVESTPSTIAREAATRDRPNIGLRSESNEPKAQPSPINDWFQDTPPPRSKASDPPDDEVGDMSDRFSMLELD